MVNTVGVGSGEGSVIVDPATGEIKNENSNTVISKLNDELLKTVAANTNGIYVNLKGTDEAVTQVKQQLSQIDRKAYGDISLMNFRTFFMWFAGAMFVLLLFEIFIPERKKVMAWKKQSVILFIFLSVALAVQSQQNKANKEYQRR